jgi:luciferase family oxidoreductase group 1
LNVPIWLLGSSGFSAQLAGQLGLPFAFAAHFSPEYLRTALGIYRSSFQPSEALDKPYVIIALNVFAAETDREAERLATSQHQSFLNLIRGMPGKIQPPVDSMENLWTEPEKALVQSRVGGSIIGNAETVKSKLEKFVGETDADELMINAMIYDHAARLRSYEIVADVWREKSSAQSGG